VNHAFTSIPPPSVKILHVDGSYRYSTVGGTRLNKVKLKKNVGGAKCKQALLDLPPTPFLGPETARQLQFTKGRIMKN
jgi:hypothetical protein